jgi:hypothetical protein
MELNMSKKVIWVIVAIIVILLILWFVFAGKKDKVKGTNLSSLQNAPAMINNSTNQQNA